jgi:hypothetical protein
LITKKKEALGASCGYLHWCQGTKSLAHQQREYPDSCQGHSTHDCTDLVFDENLSDIDASLQFYGEPFDESNAESYSEDTSGYVCAVRACMCPNFSRLRQNVVGRLRDEDASFDEEAYQLPQIQHSIVTTSHLLGTLKNSRRAYEKVKYISEGMA